MIDFLLEFSSNPTTKEVEEMEQNIQRCIKFVQVCHCYIFENKKFNVNNVFLRKNKLYTKDRLQISAYMWNCRRQTKTSPWI
jgi:hypothetical protein